MAASSVSAKANLTNIHNGTTFVEISSIVSYAPISCLLYFLAGLTFISMEFSTWNRFLLENLFLVIPGLLSITMLQGYSLLVDFTMLIICLAILMKSSPSETCQNATNSSKLQSFKPQSSIERKQFVLNFRAFMNVGTIMSILAVDFNIFPGRLCKSDIYGKGLLDIGVGSFIFGHAIVSYLARGKLRSESNQVKNIKNIIVSCSPIIFLGLLRVLSVKASNYHENVTEYGVHWNFFFTLAFVKIFSELIISILPRILIDNLSLVGVSLAVLYQYLLSYGGISDFIQKGSQGDGSRDASFFDANREGIISCAGFIALYFIAVQIGKEIFRPLSKSQLLKKLLIVDGFLWLLTLFCERFVEKVSRRMCNGTYILWMLSLNICLLAAFLSLEMLQEYILRNFNLKQRGPDLKETINQKEAIVSPRRPLSRHTVLPDEATLNKENIGFLINPLLVRAVSQNQLLYFLLGNVFTGVINLSISTDKVSNTISLLILILYLFTVNIIVVIFHVKNITTKVW